MQPALWDETISKAGEHADPQWMKEALQVVHQLSGNYARFTTDDVWQRMSGSTHEHRAMGAVMRAAQKQGWCEPTGEYTSSKRSEAHGRPVRVWRGR
jgi:hypothetical protein